MSSPHFHVPKKKTLPCEQKHAQQCRTRYLVPVPFTLCGATSAELCYEYYARSCYCCTLVCMLFFLYYVRCSSIMRYPALKKTVRAPSKHNKRAVCCAVLRCCCAKLYVPQVPGPGARNLSPNTCRAIKKNAEPQICSAIRYVRASWGNEVPRAVTNHTATGVCPYALLACVRGI